MKQILQIGIDYKDNTEYVGDRDVYDVYPQDGQDVVMDFRREAPTVKAAVYLREKRNIVLDFNGATMFMHGKYQPFFLERCENITIRNVVFRHDRAAFTEATVLEVGKDFFRVRLNPKHPCRVEDGKLIPVSEFWENHDLNKYMMFIQAFDPDNREGIGLALCYIGNTVYKDPSLPFNSDQLVAEQVDGDIVFRGAVYPFLKPGCTIVFGHEKRNCSNILMRECKNIHLENYRVLNGNGMGILPIHTKDIFLNKVEFKYDALSEGVITNQADAIHAFSCSGKFDIIDCTFEGMIDDALNIHSQFYTVETQEDDRIVLNSRLLDDTVLCTNFTAGDRIAIHRGNTTDIVAEYTIQKIRIVDMNRIEITLDRPADKHEAGSLVENLSAQPDITIRNCVFQHSNTHLRFQSSGKIRIENTLFTLPFLLTGDASYWFEASGVRDMQVRNCRFAHEKSFIRIMPEIMPTENEPYYHKNIVVENCSFVTDKPIIGSYADGIVFKNNTQIDGKPMTISLLNCGSIDAPGIAIERKTEKKEKLSVN